ncbi:MAG: hypothetical protein R3B41_00965 [Candidatus Doudnabacteria bacterium]
MGPSNEKPPRVFPLEVSDVLDETIRKTDNYRSCVKAVEKNSGSTSSASSNEEVR